MRAYCINLDRRPDKWAYMRTEFERMYIRVTRFSALDTKPGWKGCRDSHLAVMELCKDENMFIIYEDDVQFLEDRAAMSRAIAQLPDDWDCLYFGASPKEPQERYSENLFRLKNAHVTHAILWRNRHDGAVKYILNHREDIGKFDDYLATVIQPKFNCFVAYPLIATQIQFQSDTCGRSDVSTIVLNYNKYCV